MDISAKDLATRLIQLASRPPSPLQGQQETQTNSDSEKSALLSTSSQKISSNYTDFKQPLKTEKESSDYKNLIKNQQIICKQISFIQKQLLENQQSFIQQNINSTKHLSIKINSKISSSEFWCIIFTILVLLLISIALILFDTFFNDKKSR